mmetsp:Transcript_4331/g.9038  ORF Transcript_4331/g.9038 Transcript_4331/m.9038 type:complete len:143 (+) Transcript_4331:992-1420(+)
MRHHTTKIRQFVVIGYKQRELLSPQNRDPSTTNLLPKLSKCLGIDQMMTLFCTVTDKIEMCRGFGNLVTQSIRKRANLLRENDMPNLHQYTGEVISKQDRSKCNFTLHETECNNPNERYKNIAFFSSNCTGTVEGAELLCTE